MQWRLRIGEEIRTQPVAGMVPGGVLQVSQSDRSVMKQKKMPRKLVKMLASKGKCVMKQW